MSRDACMLRDVHACMLRSMMYIKQKLGENVKIYN